MEDVKCVQMELAIPYQRWINLELVKLALTKEQLAMEGPMWAQWLVTGEEET